MQDLLPPIMAPILTVPWSAWFFRAGNNDETYVCQPSKVQRLHGLAEEAWW
jgi:hypothetical protein